MTANRCWLGALAILVLWTGPAAARQWTDSSGKHSLEADLIAFDEETVVLKKDNHDLIAVPVAKLSQADREYVRSKEGQGQVRKSAGQLQTWTFRKGKKVVGRVADYGRKEVVVQRRQARVYVNDRVFDNLPQVYQVMVPEIVSHFENVPIDGKKGLEIWLLKQRGEPRTYTCEGVLLELESGDVYAVPFFLFAAEDQGLLKAGWEKWLAAENDSSQRRQQAFLLESLAQVYQQDRMVSRQIAMVQTAADWLDLWEVQLMPKPGTVGPPRSVVVPARDSNQAKLAATAQNPRYFAGAVRKVRRRY